MPPINLIFATKNKETARAFAEYVTTIKPAYHTGISFQLYQKEGKHFVVEHIHELQYIIEEFSIEELSRTVLVLEYHSLFEDFKVIEDNKLGVIANIFLSYPELKIMVLKQGHKTEPLFQDDYRQEVPKHAFIVKSISEILEFGNILLSKQQLFDPAGIRAFIKQRLKEQIGFKQDNYKKLHESRKKHFALVVDEEMRHTNLWGYALYDFGYSVLPVNYEKELEYAYNLLTSDAGKNELTENLLILRDFDLQFPDLNKSGLNPCNNCNYSKDNKETECDSSEDENNTKCDKKQKMFAFRGVRKVKKEKEEDDEKLFDCRPAFWSKFDDATTYVLTQNDPYRGVGKLQSENVLSKPPDKDVFLDWFYWIKNGFRTFQQKLNKKIQHFYQNEYNPKETLKRTGIYVNEKEKKFYLVGLSKEIEGMYDLLNVPPYEASKNAIHETYKYSRDYEDIEKRRKDDDSHSIPPINRQIVHKLLDKAKAYYKNEQYLYAALNASEALEILNGLAKSLAYEALHLKVTAEVQMELKVKGVGNFKQVLKERIQNTLRQIKRIAGKNQEGERNITMQIFNDLRVIFEENEQFEAADKAFAVSKKAEIQLEGWDEAKALNRMQNQEAKYLKTKNWPVVKNPWTSLLLLLPLLFSVFAWSFIGDYSNSGEGWIYLTTAILLILPLILRFNQVIYYIVQTGTNIVQLFVTFIVFNLYLMLAYDPGILIDIKNRRIENIMDVFITSFMNEPINNELVCYANHDSFGYRALVTVHVLISVLYLGLFISGLYRKFVRR